VTRGAGLGRRAEHGQAQVPQLGVVVGEHDGGARPAPVQVPVGAAVFPADFFLPLRRLADRDLPNIVRWNEYDRGGHFAAMEEPDLFVADLRAFSRALV
jgi:pimeloyl-ACP methyl ester carboxylesterase